MPAMEVMFTTLRITRWDAAISFFADSRIKPGGGAQDPKRRQEMDVEHRLELLVARLLNDVIPAISGVVDDDVDRVKFFERSFARSVRESPDL